MTQKKTNKFKDTLNLPHTEFSIRAHAATKEPELRARWTEQEVDKQAQQLHHESKTFLLHDGPPYANGHIHMGTALNKTLKDMVAKSKRMAGHHVPFVPGWDCHGLPIELKVAGDNPPVKEPTTAQRLDFKKKCRDFAREWIATQQEEFKQLGVLADWEKRYETMKPTYEAAIVKAFARFVRDGYIDRKGKTVPWCGSCQTVLATAEIEHHDRKDPSIYVMFPLSDEAAEKVSMLRQDQHERLDSSVSHPELVEGPSLTNKKLHLLAWTTTPWTIPLNRAVILHPSAPYVILEGRQEGEAFIVAKELAPTVCEKAGLEMNVLGELTSADLEGHKAIHPLNHDLQVPILQDDSVLLEQGTACVHSAPGCGPEDYLIGVRNGLEIYSPLSNDGKYTSGIEPAELEGMAVKDGQGWVIKKLLELGKLLHKESIKHSYPHCWRCKNGLIFRATDQWFCNLEKNDLVKNTIEKLDGVSFVPGWGKTRLSSSIANRTEWCISRQRQWGTPIVAFFCSGCKHPLLDYDLINKVADGIAQDGIEYWDNVSLADLVSEQTCKGCGNNDVSQFYKETDILDVWFDSGVSHWAVLNDAFDLTYPADMYLEGSDQHRGWFQSSALTSMVLSDDLQPAMKAIMTHGYVVDAKGHKMSKSVGNVIAPHEVIKKFSVDILRLWVASTDFEKDIVISDDLLKNVAEVYRKIRNTCRFMLANLYDFDVRNDAVALDELKALDRFALRQLDEVNNKVRLAYDAYSFTGAYQTIANYCTIELSSFYLDIIKDRLYVEKADGHARRSAQTAMYHILDTLTHLLAPMLSFLAEEISDHYQKDKAASIHLQRFVDVPEPGSSSSGIYEQVLKAYGASQKHEVVADVARKGIWIRLQELRSAVLKAIEQQREQGVVKHSLEAGVTIWLDPATDEAQALTAYFAELARKEDLYRFLKDWFIVSSCELVQEQGDCSDSALAWAKIYVDHAAGDKCPRCWHWQVTEHEDKLCSRCEVLVG